MNTVSMVGQILKDMRGDEKQQQLAFEMNLSRESISRYETGKSKVPPDVAQVLMRKFDDPRLALAIQYEYTNTGPRLLDGPNVDLHRCSVKEKTTEEAEEFLSSVKKLSFAKPSHALNVSERQNIKLAIEEAMELMTGLANFIFIGTDYINESYLESWQRHHEDLKRAGFISV